MFAFDMYDSDGSGEISPNEVTQMLNDLFGKQEVKTNQHAKAYVSSLHLLIANNNVTTFPPFYNAEWQRSCWTTHETSEILSKSKRSALSSNPIKRCYSQPFGCNWHCRQSFLAQNSGRTMPIDGWKFATENTSPWEPLLPR